MIPCRFALHTLPDGSSHIDLFISPDETGDLRTFEISSEYLKSLEKCFHEKSPPLFLITDSSTGGNSIPLVEKRPHKRIYLEFEGIIEGNRGVLIHMGYGFLEKISKICQFLSRN